MRQNLFGSTFLSSFFAVVLVGTVPLLNAETLRVPGQFSTIQEAVDAAQEGDVVELAVGLFRGDGNRDVRLHGKAITIRSAFGPKFTLVDAEGTSEEPYRGFIFDSGETTDTVIEGLTICGGATLPGAVADPFNGGGLFFLNSSATIRNCIIEDNECGCWGAGVYVSGEAAPVLIDCSISDNYSGDDGGAVFVWNQGRITLINCNLNNNEAPVTGGAITEFSGNPENRSKLINCNVVGNHAFFGGGIYAVNMEISNSIIWGNTGNNDQIEGNSQNTTVAYSIVQGGYEGVGNFHANPLFVDAANGDYRLHPGSPAIDAGDNSAIPNDILTDWLGNNRFHDDPGTIDAGITAGQAGVTDLGPIEFQDTTIHKFGRLLNN